MRRQLQPIGPRLHEWIYDSQVPESLSVLPDFAMSGDLLRKHRCAKFFNEIEARGCYYLAMRMRLCFTLLLLSFPMVALAAIAIAGTWNVKLDYLGQGGNATLVLKQDGDKLTGEYSGPHGEADVTGTINGRVVELELQKLDSLTYYHGRLSSDGTKIDGTYDYGGQRAGSFEAIRSTDH